MTPFIGALLANSAIALILIIVFLVIKGANKFLSGYIKQLTAVTVGVLLSLIFLEFLPELQAHISAAVLGFFLLGGVLLFYLLELVLHWHHCGDLDLANCDHHDHEHSHEHEHKALMHFGTLLHNMFHGIVLYSAFAVSVEFGIALSIGILLHALPQNVANCIMNHEKVKGTLFAALGGVFGVFIAFPFEHFILDNKYYLLAVTAGGLLYLALTDILPSVHNSSSTKEKMQYFFFVLLGIVMLYGVQVAQGHDHDHELHEEDHSHAHDDLGHDHHDEEEGHSHEDEMHDDEHAAEESHDHEDEEDHAEDHV